MGDDSYEKAAWRIHDGEWMSPDSNTGNDFNKLKKDCKTAWKKALSELEAGSAPPTKELKNFEKLRIAREWVDLRVVYDTFLGQYLCEGITTGPAAEYDTYNLQSDENSYISKPFFVNAFEVDRMSRTSAIKEWATTLPKRSGTKEIDKLAAFIPAIDPDQAKLFFTGWLIRAYIQAVNPKDLDANSIVNRWMLILHQQRQDSGKSGFFRWLSPYPEWVKENGLEDNKDGYIALGRYFFVLDDELGGLSRVAQHERIKSMISTSKIDVRPPYAKVDVALQRTASFCGSTNNTDIFPSAEGTTRFLVLPLTEDVFKWEEYTKQVDRTKLWAEVKHLASTSWLEDNVEDIAKYRTSSNNAYVREDNESFVVERYVRVSTIDDGKVLRAGDLMREFCETDYGYNNLNINRLGQALRKAFGERVFGHSPDGKECRGYKITLLPATAAPSAPTVSVSPPEVEAFKKSGMKVKKKRRPQR